MKDKSSLSFSLSYRDAGVDIDAGNRLVQHLKGLAKRTYRPGVKGELGGFGGFFELPLTRFRHPLLVASTDGVGTKLKLALTLGKHDTIGIDLVAMCVNDIVVTGAEPLFFLDYYATGQLAVETAVEIMTGIAAGCKQAGAALIGGETAEMPGLYHNQDYDLAGFCVGIVEKDRVLDGQRVAPGDVLIGLASSGVHANGYSLVRAVLERSQTSLTSPFGASTLGEILLMPTQIYVKPVLQLMQTVEVKALAHITGGGVLENIPRVLPHGTRAVIDKSSWQLPAIFWWLQEHGRIADADMWRTFNMGVGMVACVASADVDQALQVLNEAQVNAWLLGVIEAGAGAPSVEISG